jgi:Protein of unknown function (DUF3616)
MQSLTLTIEKELWHQGICDSSGAIALGKHHFVVANDEDNLLRIYDADQSGTPVMIYDANEYFDNNPDGKEVDIEAAAQLGDVIYWITSHGRNKKGKLKPERHQFFATQIHRSETWRFKQIGASYTQLLEDMIADSRLDSYRLETAAELPPKEPGGLNIEGLCATPAGHLLIGFRNPIVEGKALVVPLENPQPLVNGARAILGEPIALDLGGLGIRSIEYWERQERYIIVAGAIDGSDRFALYQWSGSNEPPQRIEGAVPSDFRPEAVLFYPDRPEQFQLLSDDGSLNRGSGLTCKDIEDPQHPEKYFRSLWVSVVQER